VTGRPGDSSYVGGSQCMTPPLNLGHRAAQEMLERRQHNVPRFYVATMAMVGASAPVDLLSATALAAAEVLAGLCAAYVIYPEAALTGTAATTVLDMASGNAAMNAPESALLDATVKELFDGAFGGHVSAHVRYAPTAKVPGLQAVAENYFGALACSRLLDTPPTYAGNGNLDMGGVGSPVQAMLDIEILKSLDWLDAGPGTCPERMSLEELSAVVRAGGNFLNAEHTLRNYRTVWSPKVFLRHQPGLEWDGTERALLDRCNAQWRDNLSRYEPPDWGDSIVPALDGVLARAQTELG
jgi:trimethylamine--corrinoid protein Co-methyltransferase